jgi:hypothetical protein
MKSPIVLEPGERVVYSSVRGGAAHHPWWWWLLAVYAGLHINGVAMGMLAWMIFPASPGQSAMRAPGPISLLTTAFGVLLLVRWLDLKRRPAYVVTDRRIIARRILQKPLEVDPAEVQGAARFLVKHTRYGRVVREILTRTVVLLLRSGGASRVGPVKEADGLVDLLNGLGQGVIDLRALPGVDGELARAETRGDLYFARSTITAGAERGPLFVGPGAVIGFSAPLSDSRMLQLFTIVGAERTAEDIEERMIALANNVEFGRAVVMPREGTTLRLDGERLSLSSSEREVAFTLLPADARRGAAGFFKEEPHPYR